MGWLHHILLEYFYEHPHGLVRFRRIDICLDLVLMPFNLEKVGACSGILSRREACRIGVVIWQSSCLSPQKISFRFTSKSKSRASYPQSEVYDVTLPTRVISVRGWAMVLESRLFLYDGPHASFGFRSQVISRLIWQEQRSQGETRSPDTCLSRYFLDRSPLCIMYCTWKVYADVNLTAIYNVFLTFVSNTSINKYVYTSYVCRVVECGIAHTLSLDPSHCFLSWSIRVDIAISCCGCAPFSQDCEHENSSVIVHSGLDPKNLVTLMQCNNERRMKYAWIEVTLIINPHSCQ